MELPFRAEYAKSGRSSCKGCKQNISKDSLRLAVMVQSPMFDGKVPNWYHFSCFFVKQRVKTVGDISHFESLRWEDQEKIRSKTIGASNGESPCGSSGTKENSKKKTTKRKGKDLSLSDFTIEYSKSSRATCRGCENKIIKGELRVAKKDYESEDARKYGGIDLWHHLECFAQVRQELEFWESGSQLPGFKSLLKEDQAKVEETLPKIEPIKVKKEEADDVDGANSKVKKPKLDENILKKQNKEMFYYRDQLKALPKKVLIELLEHNNQEIPSGSEQILDRLADAMTFGAIQRCKNCQGGQIVFRSGVGYFCLGHKDEWVKCETVYEKPVKKPFVVPKKLKKDYPFLDSYKYKPQERLFLAAQPSVSTGSIISTAGTSSSYGSKSIKSEPSTSGPKVTRNLPLKNMEIFILGKLPVSKQDLKLRIMKLGGKLVSQLSSQTTVIIAAPGEENGKSKHLATAEMHGIQIVPLEFLDECEKPGANAVANINKMNLASWGSDPTNRMDFSVVDSKSFGSKSKSKSFPSKVTLKLKDGLAVDPQSELEDVAHVYKCNDEIFNAALSLTDIQTQRNSYYKLQVLESDDKKSYWLFRSWGRIGTDIGNCKTELKNSREEAIDAFKALFEEKTGNMWNNRKNFVNIPGKLRWVDISYDDKIDKSKVRDIPSKLEKPVQDLVSLIFNVETMNKVMLEFELDTEKMPLGKLSKKQIQEAFKVLTKLQDCINLPGDKSDVHTILGYTNQFFTLIPHDFGVQNPPLLNDIETVKQKVEMLDALLEMEIAYSILKDTKIEDNASVNYLDSYYLKLNTEIHPLSKDSPEFQTLQTYVQNTHAETHRSYELEIIEIFKVNRQGEDKRFKPFTKLHNRKLLWHGSRLTNYAGILSQGLRIAPPEAPVTGYMFGKGVYFADMVSKSANYCMTNYSSNTGLVLLCQVALGNMLELTRAESIEKPPKGMHSVKGLGRTEPAPGQSVIREDGVEIPLGKGVVCSRHTTLLYNEYIVYDVAQIKVEYLVELKFNYK